MAAARDQTPPPVNLKERIAALQQRSVSPNTHQSAQAAPRGLPSPGSNGLRDKIAKFEGKGGVPVPRGSFAMGAPQLAENAPPRKRGELYANRVPSLGRPSGAPVGSRSGSPLPSSDESPSPGPRKRCISTGAALSSTSSNFSTDEPVPPLPNGIPGTVPRRNSLAVNFGSGRRVMSSSDAESKAGGLVDVFPPSPPSLVPEEPPEPADTLESPIPEPVAEANLLEVEESQPPHLDATSQSSEPSPIIEEPPPPDPNSPKLDPLGFKLEHCPPYDASQNISLSSSTGQSNKDGLSDYESAPQSAVSQPSPSGPEPPPFVPSSISIDTHFTVPKSPPETTVPRPRATPAEKTVKSIALSSDGAVPDPTSNSTSPTPPSTTTPNLKAESQPLSKPTFKAVVHRKVTEPTAGVAASTLAPPAIRPPTKQRRPVSAINVIDVPPSPGGGDLAVLLEDAAMLELRLTAGDGTKANDLLEKTPTNATFEPDPRQASASTLTEHVPVPSVDSGSLSARSVSIPSIREPLVDGEIPEGDETDGRSLASTTFSQRSPSHRKYLANIYRLTSRRSSSYMPGTYPRDSMSLSSEDSSPVTTPSDNGKRKGFGIAWPSASPKKGGPNVSRSSSFADKIFNRSRTKSNVSTVDQGSERNSLYGSSQPSLSLTFPSELSHEIHADGADMGTRPTSWISPGDSNSEFSPASSLLDKDIFDAFPSVPQTLPPGYYLDAENAGAERASTLAVNGRNQVNQRLSMA